MISFGTILLNPEINLLQNLPFLFFKKPYQDVLYEKKTHHQEKKENISIPDKNVYLCKNCKNPIALQKDALKLYGDFVHNFSNPSGIAFEITCFSKSRGVFTHGEYTREFSWFPDYAWCYSHCKNCSIHLGWKFNSGSDKFFGFILDKLIQSVS
jgi:hypothetical protein